MKWSLLVFKFVNQWFGHVVCVVCVCLFMTKYARYSKSGKAKPKNQKYCLKLLMTEWWVWYILKFSSIFKRVWLFGCSVVTFFIRLNMICTYQIWSFSAKIINKINLFKGRWNFKPALCYLNTGLVIQISEPGLVLEALDQPDMIRNMKETDNGTKQHSCNLTSRRQETLK